MADLVVTVPMWFWPDWIAEGDCAGDPYTGVEWAFHVSGRPPIAPGDCLYIVAHDRLRGFAPVTRAEFDPTNRLTYICRRGSAVAVTINEPIKGFRGYRKVWWPREHEQPFPDWRTAGVPAAQVRLIGAMARAA